jgi:hypothetical protein
MGKRGLWTGKRLRAISSELASLGLRVCPNTVRRLLDEAGYALHTNRKSLCPHASPFREQQFDLLNHQRPEFTRSGYPIISVDTKKKELVGRFKNNGRVWSRDPILVQDHDFRSQAKGMAIPYGIYDLHANRGTVVVGTSHDTPAFAVEAICQWWRREGPSTLPQRSRVTDPGRQRRQQRRTLPRLEARPAGKTGGCLSTGRHGLPLSERRLQVESRRASPLM